MPANNLQKVVSSFELEVSPELEIFVVALG